MCNPSKGFYERVIGPRLVSLACGTGQITAQRRLVVPHAEGVVLEVGIGSGLNMPHYDATKVTKVIGVDPSADMLALGEQRIAMAQIPVEVITESGEDIPLGDDLADTAVLTYTLCSIPDVPSALSEIRRILKPRGRVLFCEHGRSTRQSVARWQDRLNGIWGRLAGGCNLNRNTEQLLAGNGFAIETCETYALAWTPEIVGFHYRGSARPR